MNYHLKLISEHIENDIDYLIEQDEKSGKKNYKIKGIFMPWLEEWRCLPLLA